MIKFKKWFMENDAYEPYRSRIQQAAVNRENPFEAWFAGSTNGRIYIPLHRGENSPEWKSEEYADIEELLSQAGYKIQDYRQGIALDSRGRPTKIGKILNYLQTKEQKEIEAEKANYSPLTYQTRIKNNQSCWRDIINSFINSPQRSHGASSGEQQYSVVISSNIHDIGQMSTGRDWVSCMDLTDPDGHSKDVYKEVAKGGFVAYLIRSNDPDIMRPLARIAIHRYDNKAGRSIAVPEDSVYGNSLPGFEETVKNWIDSKQGKIAVGAYFRRGGKWSDSNSGFVIQGSQNGNIVLKMLQFGLQGGAWNPRRRPYVVAAMKEINSPSTKFSPKVIQKIADVLGNPANNMKEELRVFSEKYPSFVTQQIYDQLPSHWKDRFDKINPKYVAGRIANSENVIDTDLSIDNPQLGLDGPLDHNKLGRVQDLLKHFDPMKQLPEKLIQKLVKFGQDVMARYDLGSDSIASGIIRAVIHQLSMGNADTPTAINFYRMLLPYWDQLQGVHSFGIVLAKLGINGRPFLPFLKEKLATGDRGHNAEEKLNYVIDSIENGTGRSSRYTFFF